MIIKENLIGCKKKMNLVMVSECQQLILYKYSITKKEVLYKELYNINKTIQLNIFSLSILNNKYQIKSMNSISKIN
jgi:hypothetical protein